MLQQSASTRAVPPTGILMQEGKERKHQRKKKHQRIVELFKPNFPQIKLPTNSSELPTCPQEGYEVGQGGCH